VVHRIRRCLSVRRVVGHGVHDAGNETSNGGKQTCGVVGKIVREEIGHMVGRSMAIQMIGGSDSRENWRHTNVTRTNSQHINQHTVTSKYLVRWANARDQVNVFDMKTGRARINNVKDVATQRYFYSGGTVTGVEEWLGDVESMFVPRIAHISSQATLKAARQKTRFLYQGDKTMLAQGLILQLVRTERVRRIIGIEDEDTARRAHADFMDAPDTSDLAHRITAGIWVVGINVREQTGVSLYTSDHPVCVLPSGNGEQPSSIADFHLPLDPDHMLLVFAPLLSPYPREMDGKSVVLTRDQVLGYNNNQAASAERVVVSAFDDFAFARSVRAKARIQRKTGIQT
jgi:hypothetical protein